MLSIQAGIKTPAAVSPNYLLGACLRHAFSFLNIALTFLLPYATPRATLDFFTSTAQRICAINSGRDKNSCRSFAKLFAWCVPLARFFFFEYCIDISVTVRNAESHTRFFLLMRREFVLSIQAGIKTPAKFRKLSAWCVPLARFLFCHR